MQPGKEGGTWLAINKYGRIGVLLNVGQNAKDMRAVDQASRRGFYAVGMEKINIYFCYSSSLVFLFRNYLQIELFSLLPFLL